MPAIIDDGVRTAVADILSILQSRTIVTTADLENVLSDAKGGSFYLVGSSGQLVVEPLSFSELGMIGVHLRYSLSGGGKLSPLHVYLEDKPGKSSLCVRYVKGGDFLEGFYKGPYGYQCKKLQTTELGEVVKEFGKLQ